MPSIESFRLFVNDIYSRGLDKKTVAQLGEAVPEGVPQLMKGETWQRLTQRDDAFRDQNLATRQAFLDALKSNYGVARVEDLPMAVRDVLNLSDFQLNDEGRVTSHRPLTARRIKQVLAKVDEIGDLSKRVERFGEIARSAMTDGAKRDLVALVKNGGVADAAKLLDFFKSHFGGSVFKQLTDVLPNTAEDRNALAEAVAESVFSDILEPLVEAGVNHAQLHAVAQALAQLGGQVDAAHASWQPMARAFAATLDRNAAVLSETSFQRRVQGRLNAVKALNVNLEKTYHSLSSGGCDKLLAYVRLATINLGDLDEAGRRKLDKAVDFIAKNFKTFGRERSFIFADLVSGYEASLMPEERERTHMFLRDTLGSILKAQIGLSDDDLKQLSFTQLVDYVKMAANDALTDDPAVLMGEVKSEAEAASRLNFTSAETRELLRFSDGVEAKPVIPPAPPLPTHVARTAQEQAAHNEAVKKNRFVCDDLKLIAKLLHSDEGWKTDDAVDSAANIRRVLEASPELVKSVNSDENAGKINVLNLASQSLLRMLVGGKEEKAEEPAAKNKANQGWLDYFASFNKKDAAPKIPETPFGKSIGLINAAIHDFAVAKDDAAKDAAARKIATALDGFVPILFQEAQKKVTELFFSSDDVGEKFKGIPEGTRPENADLLELAKSHHPVPKNETTAQRKAREAAIMEEYSKLTVDPQAGGLGTLLKSLGTHYFASLTDKEQRSMLAGLLGSLDPEAITDVLKDKTVVEVGWAYLTGDKTVTDPVLSMGPGGAFTPAQKKVLGAFAGGLLKGCGPVAQKFIQMFDVSKFPDFVQKAVRDCKSDLKPIPSAYVQAKFNEIIRKSNGEITGITLVESKGAASIAEAFECRLTRKDGSEETVVLKLLRPDVRGRMEREIAAIKQIVSGNGNNPGALRTLNARINSLLGELNFDTERENLRLCKGAYNKTACKALSSVELAPNCPQLSDVIIMKKAPGQTFQKYMDGVTRKLDAFIDEAHLKRDENGHVTFTALTPEKHREIEASLKKMYADVQIRQQNLQRMIQRWMSNAIYGDGRFHGDLHGGNLMVDDNANITLIDFGNAPVFSKEDRHQVVNLVANAFNGRPEDVLTAMRALVSRESQGELDRQHEALLQKFTILLGPGGLDSLPEKLVAIFGELSRAGVEVPEALYNFAEAFGRVQQLSSSMTNTLGRIANVLPYLREHTLSEHTVTKADISHAPHALSAPDKMVMTLDEQVDDLLSEKIDALRKDHPTQTDLELFGHLKELQQSGELDQLLDSFNNKNPVIDVVLEYITKINDAQAMRIEMFNTHPDLFPRDEHNNIVMPPNGMELIRKRACEHIDAFLAPFIAEDPEMGNVATRLKDFYSALYADGRTFEQLVVMKTGMVDAGVLSGTVKELMGAEEMKQMLIMNGTTEDVAAQLVELKESFLDLLRDVLPKFAQVYKNKINTVLSNFNADAFAKPVSMKDSMMASMFGHKFKSLRLLGLGNLYHVYGTKRRIDNEPTPPEIRGNFGFEVALYRDEALENGKFLYVNEAKELVAEPIAQAPAGKTIANAEARRGLVEALIRDRRMTSAQYYASEEGRRVKQLLGLDRNETMNNVETAEPLTTELVRQIMIVHHLGETSFSASATRLVAGFFGKGSGKVTGDTICRLTADDLKAKVTPEVLRQLGLDQDEEADTKITNLLRGYSGQILAKMIAIGAGDPSEARTGIPPTPQQVGNWFIAALGSVAGSLSGFKDDVRPDRVFGKVYSALDAELRGLKLPDESPAKIAIRLLATIDLEAARENLAYVRDVIGDLVDLEQTGYFQVEQGNPLLGNFHGNELLPRFLRFVFQNDGLNSAWKANKEDAQMLKNLRVEVRKALYLYNPGGIDEETAVCKILTAWQLDEEAV